MKKFNVARVVCEKRFYRSPSVLKKAKKITCSRICQNSLPKNKFNTKCIICEKEIYRIPSRLNGYNTCSIACRNKWFSEDKHPKWIGRPLSNDVRTTDKERRLRYKEIAVESLGGKCFECGYSKCIAALDFHHIDPLTKDSMLKNMFNTSSWKKIQEEVKKCKLLCANCHREHHWNEKHG